MNVLAIDPGPVDSAFIVLDGDGLTVNEFGKVPNDELLRFIGDNADSIDHVVIEMIASYGMPVGREVFETCVYIGVLIANCDDFMLPYSRLTRKEVTLHLCGTARAKDSNIRQRCLDMFPSTGGGKTPQVGIKKKPGPLFGVSVDVWAALAVGLTYKGVE